MPKNKPMHTPEEAAELLAKGLKGCSECRQVLPLDRFGVQAKAPSGRTSMCKPCRRKYRIMLRKKKQFSKENARKSQESRLKALEFRLSVEEVAWLMGLIALHQAKDPDNWGSLIAKEWLQLSPEDLGLSPEVWRKMYLRKVDEKTVGRLVKGRCQRLRATGERFLKQSEEWA